MNKKWAKVEKKVNIRVYSGGDDPQRDRPVTRERKARVGNENVVGLFGRKGKRAKTDERRSVGVEDTAGSYAGGMFAGGAAGTRRDQKAMLPEESDRLSLATSLGRRVLAHRDRCAMSQEEYAEQAGIGRTRLSQIEGGKVWPSRRIRAKLATFMGVSPESLWHDENANGLHKTEEDNQDTRRTINRAAS
jgi:DNA-binding XRE family transcriptional regulator